MKSLKISITFILATLILIVSCTEDERFLADEENLSINENTALQNAYDFESVDFNIDKTESLTFKINSNSKKGIFINPEDLDLKSVTQIDWKNDKISYLIPYISNANISVVISIDKSGIDKELNFDTAKIVENYVDKTTGNGNIIITDINDSIERVFENGILIVDSSPFAKTFRECFDDAYDSICDGFIGCLAWYSSPLPALTAVAYCGIT